MWYDSDRLFCFQITANVIDQLGPVLTHMFQQLAHQGTDQSPPARPQPAEPVLPAPVEPVPPAPVAPIPPAPDVPVSEPQEKELIVNPDVSLETSSVISEGDSPQIPACSDESPQATKLTRHIFSELRILFPEKFRETVIPDSLPPGVMMFKKDFDIPKLCVKPLTAGTWLDPPNKAQPSDTVGYWPTSTSFPKKSSSTPAKYRWNPPKRPLDTVYHDPKLEAFVEGPILGESVLDPYAFSNPSCNVKGSHQANMDRLLRSALHESFLDSEYITMLLEMVPMIKNEIQAQLPESSQTEDDRSFPTLDLLHNLLGLLAHGVHRNINTQLSAYVSNKLSIRDHVLDKLVCPPLTKEYLRGSDFVDSKVFGPIPESVKTALSSHNAGSLICRPKRFTPKGPGPSTSGYKRPAPSRPNVIDKRQKVDKPAPPPKPATQFFPAYPSRPKTSGKKSGWKPSPYGGKPGNH